MTKELKETVRTMSHQIENINKKLEVVKRNQIEILELKSTITEMQNSPEALNSRIEQAEKKNQQILI